MGNMPKADIDLSTFIREYYDSRKKNLVKYC